MTRRQRFVLPAVVCVLLGVMAPAAFGKTHFRPRVGGALGLIPPVNSHGRFGADDVASGALTPVTYHGGAVMAGGVTVHTIFWAPSGFAFQGSPGGGIPTYKGTVQEFFTDAAADSTGSSGSGCTISECNMLTVLPQYGQGSTDGTPTAGGAYTINYNTGTDSITDTDPYPSSGQCASPNNATGACLTDAQVQQEVDHLVQTTAGHPRGLHNLWYVFLPPNVDECILPGVCGTNAFGGYHSVSDVGHGTTIYAVTIDPIIEAGSIAQGGDPQGNPDAEVTADIAGHETVEAMTDPEGVGYMDPNGFEVADKCEFGPQHGTPLGFAGNGSPYNQVINGDKWLLQEMWSNTDNGCVQSTTKTSSPLPLPQVYLKQFSTSVSGNIASNHAGVHAQVTVIRMGADGNPAAVAQASGLTNASGAWSVTLQHPVGDDRDEIDVDYSGANAPTPNHQVILTGNGGNPFNESGWTGWTAMDDGTATTNSGGPQLQIAPCFQTGVLQAAINGTNVTPPNGDDGLVDFCSTQTDVATIPLSSPVTAAKALTVSSNDNRAFSDPNLPTANPVGGLVKLTVSAGEPDSVSPFVSPLIFTPGGFPTCAADLEAQSVSCSGLVPSASYTVTDGATKRTAAADDTGAITVALAAKRGDSVVLSNSSHRPLSTLHVAHLRVDITGEQSVLSGGTCEPYNYYAPPLSTPPTSSAAGDPTSLVGGSALTDSICPANGKAAGLSATQIVQTDERSGGSTQTEVPDIQNTSPMDGETVYGTFTALAQSGLPGPDNTVIPTDSTSSIALSIVKSSGGRPVFRATNVDTAKGVTVRGIKPGTYKAIWTLKDANGDTRTVTSRFIEHAGLVGPRGKPGPRPKVSCKIVTHHKIKCTVTFPKSKSMKGKLRARLARGGKVAALGHGTVSHGAANVTLREVGHVTRGAWTITLVLTQAHKAASTTKLALRVR